jgi:hypothetical protein
MKAAVVCEAAAIRLTAMHCWLSVVSHSLALPRSSLSEVPARQKSQYALNFRAIIISKSGLPSSMTVVISCIQPTNKSRFTFSTNRPVLRSFSGAAKGRRCRLLPSLLLQ